jgi:hypothetical protein
MDAERAKMAGWLAISVQGAPLPPDLYNALARAGYVADGVLTDAGDRLLVEFYGLVKEADL